MEKFFNTQESDADEDPVEETFDNPEEWDFGEESEDASEDEAETAEESAEQDEIQDESGAPVDPLDEIKSEDSVSILKKVPAFKEWLESENAVQTVYLVFGFCAIVLLMVLLQFSTTAICCGDWDGYYHIRWSALIWESFKSFSWLPEFKWLPLTVLNPSDYADHHFLFHLLQIPFLWFFEPVTAAKISAVFYGSLAIFSVYWLL